MDAGIAGTDADANGLRSLGQHTIRGMAEPIAVWAVAAAQ